MLSNFESVLTKFYLFNVSEYGDINFENDNLNNIVISINKYDLKKKLLFHNINIEIKKDWINEIYWKYSLKK